MLFRIDEYKVARDQLVQPSETVHYCLYVRSMRVGATVGTMQRDSGNGFWYLKASFPEAYDKYARFHPPVQHPYTVPQQSLFQQNNWYTKYTE